MKRIIFMLLALFLTSCFFSSDNNEEIEKAKQEIIWTWAFDSSKQLNNNSNSWITDEALVESNEEIKDPSVEITQISKWDPIIEIDDLTKKDFYSWEIEITWKTLWKVDKIDVYFINKSSIYPEDLYTLKQFKSWDSTFKYMASSWFKTLDFWLNEYTFTVYSSWNVFKLKININIPEKDKLVVEEHTELIEKLVTNLNDWTEVDNEIFTDISNLKVKELKVENIKCDNITDYLTETYDYPYWNTCRDIIKDKSIWFYVLRLEWDKYKYEKHYVNYEKSLYWTLLLEEWYWVSVDMLIDKNKELKVKEWNNTLKVDELLK